ncbi:Uncharacterised protein [Bordetella avium]|nr:Uncharacterised protein [Bordetella avium]
MPPDAQLYMRDRTEAAVWASLRAEHTIINTSTLALAHGAAIAGEWIMLAVLDSKPDWENPFAEGGPMINTSDMAESMHGVLNLVRKLAGRSPTAYAVTLWRSSARYSAQQPTPSLPIRSVYFPRHRQAPSLIALKHLAPHRRRRGVNLRGRIKIDRPRVVAILNPHPCRGAAHPARLKLSSDSIIILAGHVHLHITHLLAGLCRPY